MQPNKMPLPTFTMIPNIIFDYWQATLSPGEFSVLSYMCRKLYGFHKYEDKISISQLSKGTNQSRPTVIAHIKKLIGYGLINRVKGKTDKGDDDSNTFSINLEEEEGSKESLPPVVKNFNQGVVKNLNTQKKTFTKETTTKENEAAPAAAVFSCLSGIEIPHSEKEWLCSHYDEATVSQAVAFATNPKTVIKTSLAQVIKWACKTKPNIPQSEAVLVEENKSIAKSVEDRVIPGNAAIAAGSSKIEIYFQTGCVVPTVIEYVNTNFKKMLAEALRRFGVKLRPAHA